MGFNFKINGYEVRLNKDNGIVKESKYRVLSKCDLPITRFYKNYRYISDIVDKKDISPIKHLYSLIDEKGGHICHYEPKMFIDLFKLKFKYKKYWFQKEENIRYLINIIFIIIGLYISYKKL